MFQYRFANEMFPCIGCFVVLGGTHVSCRFFK